MKKNDLSMDSSHLQKSLLSTFFSQVRKKNSITAEITAGISTAILTMFLVFGGASIISEMMGGSQTLFMLLAALSLLVSGVVTIIASFYTKVPMVFSLSLGINTLLATTIVSNLDFDWSIALGLIFIESILFSMIALTPFPKKFIQKMPEFFSYAWPACIGGIFIFIALIGGRLISFSGSFNIALFTFKSPEVFIFFSGVIAVYLLFKTKKFNFYAVIPILMGLVAMLIPSVPGANMNKGVIIIGAFFMGWMLLYSILVDAKKKYALSLSLTLLVAGLGLSIFFSEITLGAIITRPTEWYGATGIFYFPPLNQLQEIAGYPFLALGGVFSQFNQLWAVLFSLLIVHFITTWALISSLHERIKKSFDHPASHAPAEKRIFAMEGASSIIGAHFCLGGGTLTIGSIFSYILGSKTIFSSIVAGLFMIAAVFFIPAFRNFFNLFTLSPLLFVAGSWLLYQSIKHIQAIKDDLIPILAVFITGVLTWNLYVAFFAGLLSFALDRLSKKKGNEINSWIWVCLIFLLIFTFIVTPVSFINFVN